ncbi:MAG: type II secretion system F family protein [Actinomycetota bacterium]
MPVVLGVLLLVLGLGAVYYGFSAGGRLRKQELRRLVEAEMGEPSMAPEGLYDLVERAGLIADRALGAGSFKEKIEVMLTRAGSSLKPGEMVAVGAGAALAAGTLVFAVTGSFMAVLVAAAGGASAVWAWFSAKGRRRIDRIEQQLPSVLRLVAGSLDAGASVLGALDLVAKEGDPPLGAELARAVAETKVGLPVVESLSNMAARIGSRDVIWTVEAIRIQSMTGGKLADTLRVLADFMRTRLEVRGEIRALSAEARLSAKVLTGLPLLVGAYLFMFRRAYLEPLYVTGAGKTMLAFAAMGIVVGSWWMRRMVRVEV